MAGDHPSSSETLLAELLGDLPVGFTVRPLVGGWFVAGPAGVFVVGSAGLRRGSRQAEGRAGQGADRTAPSGTPDLGRLAGDVRAVLADHLTLVPFVQSLVMTADRRVDRAVRATVVPPDLLLGVLVGGGAAIDEVTLARIASLASAGHLDRVGAPDAGPARGWVGAAPVD